MDGRLDKAIAVAWLITSRTIAIPPAQRERTMVVILTMTTSDEMRDDWSGLDGAFIASPGCDMDSSGIELSKTLCFLT